MMLSDVDENGNEYCLHCGDLMDNHNGDCRGGNWDVYDFQWMSHTNYHRPYDSRTSKKWDEALANSNHLIEYAKEVGADAIQATCMVNEVGDVREIATFNVGVLEGVKLIDILLKQGWMVSGFPIGFMDGLEFQREYRLNV